MTMKLKGRKASLYATAMAISLVAMNGTAFAQSASNGKFSTVAKATEGKGALNAKATAATEKKNATLTAAQIEALKVAAAKKVDLTLRNTVSAQVLSSLSATSKAALDAAKITDAANVKTAAEQALAAAKLNGTVVAGNTANISAITGGIQIGATAATATFLTDDVTKVGTVASGTALFGATARAAQAIAQTAADAAFNTRSVANAEAQSATAALPGLQAALASAIAAVPAGTVVDTVQAVINARIALSDGQQKVAVTTARAQIADANYVAAAAALTSANSSFTSTSTTKLNADTALSGTLAAKSTADGNLNAALSVDTAYAAAVSSVKIAAANHVTSVIVEGLTATSAPNAAQAKLFNDMTGTSSYVAGQVFAASGAGSLAAVTSAIGTLAPLTVGTAATAPQLAFYAALGITLPTTAAGMTQAVIDGATNLAIAGFSADRASLLKIEALDDQTIPGTEVYYASNGVARQQAVLATAAASTNASIKMASDALTGADAALEAGAAFETEVLDTLVNHETRIAVLEDVVGDVASNTVAIATETAERKAADAVLTAAIETEVTERKAADAVLTTAIATEVTERKAADTALDTRVTATANGLTKEVADRIAADTANNNARIAEDKRLNDMIVSESNARVAMGNELRDRIASSTATAIALGGAALLPDMGFSLSGNVAFYEGAQAIALNAAAKVGPNAYVTAAAGGGLNKRGSVGGRVGFVIGF